jgi:hypothetical protein
VEAPSAGISITGRSLESLFCPKNIQTAPKSDLFRLNLFTIRRMKMKPKNTLLFALPFALAFLMAATSAASAQENERERRILTITPTTQLQVSGRLAGKLHMVTTFLETKPFYSRGVSSDQFVKRALAQMEPAPTPAWLKTYLLRVYEYHAKGVSADVVYATDDGRAFTELYNAVAKTYKPGMTKEEFERQLIPGTTPGYGDPRMRKPWWVNCVRKVVDWIDDHWKD